MESKRFILTKQQLNEYIENKKADKIFYEIIEALHNNKKYLKENVSIENANQSILEDFKRKGLINTKVEELLTKYKIIDLNYKFL